MTAGTPSSCPKTGILWDMDGVLVDSGRLHYLSWRDTLAHYNIPFSEDDFQHTFGMNNTGVLNSVTDNQIEPELIQMISTEKENLFREKLPGQVNPLPGVRIWLQKLGKAGFVQVVASSAPLQNIHALLQTLDLQHYFQALISAEGMRGKPDPQVFLYAASQINITPECCLVIEDSINGIRAAASAGMKCLAITTTHEKSELYDADRIIESFKDHPPRTTVMQLLS